MSRSDKQASIILVIIIISYIAVWIAGLLKHKLLNYVSFLNAISGLAIIIYWVQNQLRIVQHTIETREIVVLSLEAVVVGISIYSIMAIRISNWLKVSQYIVFGVHLSVLILFLIFMLTFRMTKMI